MTSRKVLIPSVAASLQAGRTVRSTPRIQTATVNSLNCSAWVQFQVSTESVTCKILMSYPHFTSRPKILLAILHEVDTVLLLTRHFCV